MKLTVLKFVEQKKTEQEQLYRPLAFPMSLILSRYYTSISSPLLQYILSMADLQELAEICQSETDRSKPESHLTSAWVIRSGGLFHCVAFVWVL